MDNWTISPNNLWREGAWGRHNIVLYLVFTGWARKASIQRTDFCGWPRNYIHSNDWGRLSAAHR